MILYGSFDLDDKTTTHILLRPLYYDNIITLLYGGRNLLLQMAIFWSCNYHFVWCAFIVQMYSNVPHIWGGASVYRKNNNNITVFSIPTPRVGFLYD